MISNKKGLQYIAELFIQEGIEDIVISPGSRNAPMMLTFPEYKEFNCYSIIDERSAGFFALGLAQKTRKPVVLNCTSGSALLNYAPALAEAYYQNIPLIVLSADRPAKLIDQGDGQAIRQKDIYHNYIRRSVHLPEEPNSDDLLSEYQNLILQAIQASMFPVCGPVHINVPLDEPIYGLQEKAKLNLLKIHKDKTDFPFDNKEIDELHKIWNSSKKKLILIGQNPPDDELNKTLIELSQREDIIIMTETTSNQIGDGFIANIDRVLSQVNETNELDLLPDLLITLGGHIVSKKIKAWLRNDAEYQHWQLSLDSQSMNTFFHLSNHIHASNNHFFRAILKATDKIDSNYKKHWSQLDKGAEKLHDEYLKTIPFSDLMVFDKLEKSMPKTALNLHFSNSTPIRYSQLFNYNRNIIIDSNRGVSGIDGSVSTALGASLKNKEITCLVTGDLSFFYDGNAFWNHYLHPNFRIILINNGGGGIFRFIDGPMQSKHLDYFETPHKRSAKSLALEAGMIYNSCSNEKNLDELFKELFSLSDKATLLEVFTPRKLNDQILKKYFSFLKKAE